MRTPKKEKLNCRKCNFVCDDRGELARHHLSQHGRAYNLQNFDVNLDDYDDALRNE